MAYFISGLTTTLRYALEMVGVTAIVVIVRRMLVGMMSCFMASTVSV
jgi:hypothetical protein